MGIITGPFKLAGKVLKWKIKNLIVKPAEAIVGGTWKGVKEVGRCTYNSVAALGRGLKEGGVETGKGLYDAVVQKALRGTLNQVGSVVGETIDIFKFEESFRHITNAIRYSIGTVLQPIRAVNKALWAPVTGLVSMMGAEKDTKKGVFGVILAVRNSIDKLLKGVILAPRGDIIKPTTFFRNSSPASGKKEEKK